jgi:hypothetical protein
METESEIHKHEVPFKDLMNPAWYGSFYPNLFLKNWGFDLNKEVSCWFDPHKNSMVFVQHKDAKMHESLEKPPFLDRKTSVPYSIAIMTMCLLLSDLIRPEKGDWAVRILGLLDLVVIVLLVRTIFIGLYNLFEGRRR